MAKIIYCWELGADLGHISSFVPLAKELLRRGHEVAVILREVQRAQSVLGNLDIKIYSAPIWNFSPVVAPKPTGAYTDILFHFGYLDAPGLSGMFKAWRELFQILAPDLILADHSPTAILAAYSSGLQSLTYGSGFFAPPAEMPLPSMASGPFTAPVSRMLQSESRVVKSINSALESFPVASLQSLAELFPPDRNLLLTYPELDHYPNRKDGRYYGVVANAAGTAAPKWPSVQGKKVFAYLKMGYPHFERVLASLTALGCSTVVYAGGIPERDRVSHSHSRVSVSKHAVDIHAAMQQCDVAVCHAGIGTAVAALLAGKPLLLLPMQGEQSLMAARVAELGAGLPVSMGPPLPDFVPAIKRLLSENRFKAGAEAFAAVHQTPSQVELVAALADRCEECL